MRALVVYDSQYGNTERIAQAIAEALRVAGEAQAVRVSAMRPEDLTDRDLLILGCPTQGWRPTPATQALLRSLSAGQLQGISVACFDTRFQKPRWLTGSAAVIMGKRLAELGISLLKPPESFFVQGTEGPLLNGELERAARWAATLAPRSQPQPLAQR